MGFVVKLGPSQLTSFHFIHCYEDELYQPTLLKLQPPICRITANATIAGKLSTIFASTLWIKVNSV